MVPCAVVFCVCVGVLTCSSFKHHLSILLYLHLCRQEEGSAASLQMRMEKCIASQEAAIKMAKNVMEMNKQLQIRLLDMLECRLLHPPGNGGSAAVRKKKAKTKTKKSGDGSSAAAQKRKTEKSGDQSLPEQGEGQPEPAGS